MRHARWLTIALLLLASLAAPLFGQAALTPTVFLKKARADARETTPSPAAARIEGPPILPGTIASTSIHVPAGVSGGKARGRFRLVAFPNVRLFGDTTGVIAAGRDVLIPVTYSVPRTQDVGLVAVARLFVDWSDGTRWEARLEANVQARHGLRVAANPDLGARSSTDYMVVRYRVTNVGNGTDTVDMKWDPGWNWRVQQTDDPMIVAAGQTMEGTVNVEWPHGTAGGEMHVVQVTAAGRGTSTMAGVIVRVPFRSSEALGLASAQSNVFVGSSSSAFGEQAPSIAITSASQLSPDTRISLVYRRPQAGVYSRVFANEVGAPQARVELRRPGFVGALGTVFRPLSSLLGSVAQGDGADIDVESGAVRVSMLAARPMTVSLGNSSDNVLNASVDVNTAVGVIGVGATGTERVDSLVDGRSQVRAAGVHFRRNATGQRLNVEVGYLQLQDAVGARAGAALDANYDGTVGGASLFGRVHSVPAVIASSEVLPSAASIGANLPIVDAVSVNVSASQAAVTQIGQTTSRSQGVSGGLGLSSFGTSAQIMANLRRADATPAASPSVGRTISTSLSLPLGDVALDGYAELGTRTTGDSVLDTKLLRGGIRWSGELGYLWAGVAYARNEMPGNDLHIETSGSLTFGPTQWQFGASLNNMPESYFVDRRTTPLPLNVGGYWTRLSLAASSATLLVGGAEYEPAMLNGKRWRLSLGVQQALDVPLPVRRAPVVSGEVFDDANGNGIRDEGEAGMAGVVLKLGGDRRQTSSSGDFNFADWSLRGQHLEIDAASLPDGYMVRPDLRLASHGHVSIPVIKAAALQIVVHVQRADGSLSDAIDAPEGLVATLAAGRRVRDASATRGVVDFDAVLPGEYDLTVTVPPTATRPAGVTQKTHLTLQPGTRKRLDIGAPPSKREIRFGPSAAPSAPTAH